jgi:transposase
MANRVNPSIANQVRLRIEQGESTNAIHRSTRITKQTIRRWRLNLDLFSNLYAPSFIVLGQPKKLSYDQEVFILTYLEDQPTSYLDEIVQVVYDEFDIEVSVSLIYRLLEQKRWSRKVVQQKAAQQSQLLRSTWRGRQIQWVLEDLCFVDESACNERTGDRKRGWVPVGLNPSIFTPLKRSKRWSLLPALTHRGYLSDPLIYQGIILFLLLN